MTETRGQKNESIVRIPHQRSSEAIASRTILAPRSGGPADRIAGLFEGPVKAWAAVTLSSLIVVAAVMIGLGYVLVAELLPDGVAAWDRAVATWFVAQRTPTLDSVSAVGSMLGSTFVVIGIAVVVGIVLAIRRHWLVIGFLAAALLIEVGSFLAATFAINRPRPAVPQLDIAPPTSSYPSGHTAAALVLYISIAIVVWTFTDSRLLRTLFVILAIVVPVFVALSRLYRGMHHATDVIASVLLALACLTCAVLTTRVTASVAIDRSRGVRRSHRSTETATEVRA